MKKVFLLLTLPLLALSFTACNKGNDEGNDNKAKLVKQLSQDNGYMDFEYDNQQRLTRDSGSIPVSTFTYAGNTITQNGKGFKNIFLLNSDGYLIERTYEDDRFETYTYTYQNGYLHTVSLNNNLRFTCKWENGNMVEKIYPSGKSAYFTYYDTEDKMNIELITSMNIEGELFKTKGLHSKNLLKQTDDYEGYSYKYTFDDQGYVTEIQVKREDSGNTYTQTLTYY